MGQQSEPVDVESLQEKSRRRGCLDAFFTMSIVLLYVGLTAVTVCGVMVVRSFNQSFSNPQLYQGDAPPQTYKTENFAYLRINSSHLNSNSTMRLALVHSGEGTSVGSNFDFNQEQHLLTPKQAGNYFMYIDLSISCTGNCNAGLLRVQVGQKLTCEVELPSRVRSVKRKCWTVARMDEDQLLTKITVPKEGLSDWKLDVRGSGIGMFLVD